MSKCDILAKFECQKTKNKKRKTKSEKQVTSPCFQCDNVLALKHCQRLKKLGDILLTENQQRFWNQSVWSTYDENWLEVILLCLYTKFKVIVDLIFVVLCFYFVYQQNK